ncbi:MAG: omptin family outer membrane protease [Nitrospinota bacterium]
MKYFLLIAAVLLFSQKGHANSGTLIFPDPDPASFLLVGNNEKEATAPNGLKDKDTGLIGESPGVGIEANKWGLSLGYTKMSGYTQYEIGGMVEHDGITEFAYFPISRLRFPLNLYLLNVGARIFPGNQFSFFTRFSINITGNQGKMEDSDFFSTGELAIFSLSDTDLSAESLEVGANFEIRRTENHSLKLVLGYLGQYFDYDVKNVIQWSPPRPDLEHFAHHGKVLEYNITYHIPYFGADLNITPGNKFDFGFFVHYSPFTFVRDKDDHILREKRSKGKTDGNATRLGTRYFRTWGNSWFATFWAEAIFITTKGKNENVVYGGEFFGQRWTIEQDNQSRQFSLSFRVGRKFGTVKCTEPCKNDLSKTN